MTTSIASLEHRYRLHTLTIGFRANDPRVIAALDLRLRGLPSPAEADADVLLEFRTLARPFRPDGDGRPVYDTPYGSLEYFPDQDLLAGHLGGVSVLCEPGRGSACLTAPAFAGTSLYLATHPIATVCLMELLERRGLFCLHAGCLTDRADHGVLVSGPSGAGKSTLCLALVRAGLGFLSDDLVFITTAEDGAAFDAVGFPDAVGISRYAATCFPELRAHFLAPPPGFPKALRRINDIFDTRTVGRCRPRALLFPTVTGERSSHISPLDPGEALVRLVPDVLATEAEATQAHLDAIAALLDQVRCYQLRTGRDLARAAELVCSVI